MQVVLTVTVGYFPDDRKPMFATQTSTAQFQIKNKKKIHEEINQKVETLRNSIDLKWEHVGTRVDVISVSYAILQ